jgi:hypothetical protein
MAQKLFGKYNVTKANGEPTDPEAQYFVLRIDTDPAALVALIQYAYAQDDLIFREQLLQWAAEYYGKGDPVDNLDLDESWANAWKEQKDNEFCPVCGLSKLKCDCK